MGIKKILASVFEGAKTKDHLAQYDEKYDKFAELFIEPQDIDEIEDKPILLLMDNKPHSLISLGWALRLTIDLKEKLFVIDKGPHSELVEEEAEKYEVEIIEYYDIKEVDLSDVKEVVQAHEIGIIVINIRHELVSDLLDISDVPVFVTKIE